MRVSWLLLLMLGAASLAYAEEETKIQAGDVSGGVFIKRLDEKPQELTKGFILKEGDEIRVGPAGRIQLNYGGKGLSKSLVAAGSTLRVDSIKPVQLFLEKGGINSKIDSSSVSQFTIKTPVAVASTRGTSFLMHHELNTTDILLFDGNLELRTISLSGEVSKEPRGLNAGSKIIVEDRRFLDPEPLKENERSLELDPEKSEPQSQGPSAVKIQGAEKSYYIRSSCELADSIMACEDGEESQTGEGQSEMEYEDYSVYLGDTVDLPLRVFMPYEESKLDLTYKNTHISFKGVMVACASVNSQNGNLKIKPFQSGKAAAEIEVKGNETYVRIKSRNTKGLKTTSVNVSEGLVAVTAPWLCEDCSGTKTFLIEPGDCFRFDYRGLPQEADDRAKLPRMILEPPREYDITGSKEKEK